MEKKNKINNKNKSQFSNLRSKSSKIKSDVQGSYTGVPINEHDYPVQDVDDL